MRLLSLVLILTLAPAMVLAQRGGGHVGGGGGGGMRGGGSMGGGGMRSAPSVSRGVTGGGSVGVGGFHGGSVGTFRGGNFGGTVGGFRGGVNRGYYGGYRGAYGFGLGYGYPYWGYGFGYPYYGYWPGYYDGYYPYDYGYGTSYGYPSGGGYYDGSYGGSDYGYGSQQPSAVINQNFAPPMPPSSGSTADSYYRRPDYYLIAFTDHSIQAAIAFHVNGDQLYYTTRDNVEKQVRLANVDRRFSEQLNRDRHVQFQLP